MTSNQLKQNLGKIVEDLPKSKLASLHSYAQLLSSEKDFWLHISDEEKKGIEKGEQDFVNGETLTLNEAMAKYEKKYRRKLKG